jgi:uncharacterized membrane protein YvbJ
MKKLFIVALLCFSTHAAIFCNDLKNNHDLADLLFKKLNEENDVIEFDEEEHLAYKMLVEKTATLIKKGMESGAEQVNSSIEFIKKYLKK